MEQQRAKRRLRRAHCKSTRGCLTCKQRRVKCDEGHPVCNRCARLDLVCRFSGDVSLRESPDASPVPAMSRSPNGSNRPIKRRGRGRPIKNWTLVPLTSKDVRAPRTPFPNQSGRGLPALNLADTDLMLHFISHTGPSLITYDQHDYYPSIFKFWTYDIFELGLSFPFVLHLVYALSARHLLHRLPGMDACKMLRLQSLIEHHTALGVPEMTTALANLDAKSGGALYVAAMLTCLGVFAVGPSSPLDLLLCVIDGGNSASANIPAMRGLRLIVETIPKSDLFTGLTEPLGRAQSAYQSSDKQGLATCAERGSRTVHWIPALRSVRHFLLSRQAETDIRAAKGSSDAAARLAALELLEGAFEGMFGRGGDGRISVEPANKMVMRWLYRTDEKLVRLVKSRDAVALVLLAYWGVLLNEARIWYLVGWPEHIIGCVRDLLQTDKEAAEISGWPSEIIDSGLEGHAYS